MCSLKSRRSTTKPSLRISNSRNRKSKSRSKNSRLRRKFSRKFWGSNMKNSEINIFRDWEKTLWKEKSSKPRPNKLKSKPKKRNRSVRTRSWWPKPKPERPMNIWMLLRLSRSSKNLKKMIKLWNMLKIENWLFRLVRLKKSASSMRNRQWDREWLIRLLLRWTIERNWRISCWISILKRPELRLRKLKKSRDKKSGKWRPALTNTEEFTWKTRTSSRRRRRMKTKCSNNTGRRRTRPL